MSMKDKRKIVLSALFVIALFIGALLAGDYIRDNSHVRELISSFGYGGIFITSIIGGLNLFVPVPPTAFIPVFEASGFSLFSIIAIMVVGITIADFVSYYIGVFIKREFDGSKYRLYNLLKGWCEGKPNATRLIVFLYASIVPIPNELLLLPLGALGIPLVRLVPAFVLGTIVHVSLLAFGLTSLAG